MNETIPICYRLLSHKDYSFIYATWLSSQRNQPELQLTTPTLYKLEQNKKIDYLLKHSNTMVAYLDGEPDTLLAFCTYQYHQSHLLIHYAFTKSEFREQQIQSNLLELINPNNLNIILTCTPPAAILKHMQTKTPMLYDYFFFQRNYYGQEE